MFTNMMVFKTPLILIIIPFVLLYVLWLKYKAGTPSIRFSSLSLVSSLRPSLKQRFMEMPFYLRLVILALLIVALAGPRAIISESHIETEGIDIVLTVDVSGSMAAEDFTLNGKRLNRLTVVKSVIDDFIGKRNHDQIGLIAFSALAYTVSPLTTDYSWLRSNLERLDLGIIEDGTAIGSGLASSLNRLKKSQAKSKVVILLTDGMNNKGTVDPIAAAQAAKALGIKVYTIGAGSKGLAPFPVKDMWGRTHYRRVEVDIDEESLQKIADITHGKYFRATDTESLIKIYDEIDSLEKTKINQLAYKEYRELFVYVLWFILALLVFEFILANTVVLRLPS